MRDYIECVEPTDVDEIIVLHQDNDVEHLVRAATVPVCVMRATDYLGIA